MATDVLSYSIGRNGRATYSVNNLNNVVDSGVASTQICPRVLPWPSLSRSRAFLPLLPLESRSISLEYARLADEGAVWLMISFSPTQTWFFSLGFICQCAICHIPLTRMCSTLSMISTSSGAPRNASAHRLWYPTKALASEVIAAMVVSSSR